MPLNTLRLNHQASSHPNDRIVFIKPLPRPSADKASYDTADLLLRAIAAQCLPIMKSHYLSVTTLEEHEPNPEFIGRNFNNGEIIQLVLKSKSGSWLPLNFIQMVMMHELAHNIHMNHKKGFWETRNKFAGEMRALWAKGYTGDGLWGSGQTLGQLGRAMQGNVVRSEQLQDLPLCGGTFRSRGRKRKRKTEQLTWKEKKDRRIEKKFGKNGVALGEDEDKRLCLEIAGRGPVGVKPRVAQSKRGRELRAAAALSRFGSNKQELEDLENVKKEEDDESTDGMESEYEDDEQQQEDALDVDGKRMVDSKGHGMIRVCGEEDGEDNVAIKREMEELEDLNLDNFAISTAEDEPSIVVSSRMNTATEKPRNVKIEPESTSTESLDKALTYSSTRPPTESSVLVRAPPDQLPSSGTVCPICTTSNPPFTSTLSITCATCSHVLYSHKDPESWKCRRESCRDSMYVNAGDCGVCGGCGMRKEQN